MKYVTCTARLMCQWVSRQLNANSCTEWVEEWQKRIIFTHCKTAMHDGHTAVDILLAAVTDLSTSDNKVFTPHCLSTGL